MLNIEKYLKNKKVKPEPFAQASFKVLSIDDVYEQGLIHGGIGVEPSMQYLMNTELGNPTTFLSQYHGVTSNGMQLKTT